MTFCLKNLSNDLERDSNDLNLLEIGQDSALHRKRRPWSQLEGYISRGKLLSWKPSILGSSLVGSMLVHGNHNFRCQHIAKITVKERRAFQRVTIMSISGEKVN